MTSTTERWNGMGAIVGDGGVAFRVWAPHADTVVVTGDFNKWSESANPLESEGNGYWYALVPEAKTGDEYKYIITNGEQVLSKRDPYSYLVTNSVGNSVIYDHSAFDWEGVQAHCPPFNEMVIYEMHVGTFNSVDGGVGDLEGAMERLHHVLELGANTVQLMPVAEFAGDQSWGYNPADPFAVESAYGGPDALKQFVKKAHEMGIAVIQDVVYNHFGPSDLDLWQFDGWSENGKGGIYFYQDWKSETPWGDTRPDYGREEVRRFIRDNALMWLKDYRMDGLRLDMTPYMRSKDGSSMDIPEGWSMMRWIADTVREEFPGRILIAEDLHGNPLVTSTAPDGAGFHSQWDSHFVHPVREVITEIDDEWRSIPAIVEAVTTDYGDAFARVVYTESHDEVANGKARVPQEVNPNDPSGWVAQKLSTLGAALALTSPGIPMLFQGQEFLEGAWFRDSVPLDWSRDENYAGIANLYRDLINLRLNRSQSTRGLTGQNTAILKADDEANFLVFHRWAEGGVGDDVVVVVNLDSEVREKVDIGLPAGTEKWTLRFNSDAKHYSSLFGGFASYDMESYEGGLDGQPRHGNLSIAPYTVLIYSRG
ncbi:1,4-alpha-glucan branching enzyme GlgB [Corynebacterium kalinowskii]|uniref:1,4-alpha-glucan branching enzyme n=1 Tax=Corynebacterium kalinowskii TaxID=2675216 RepID=A0A6B8VQ78_9CORY|nr:alpha-amylase family glycosyl hydrolase [Corynebacterium kalinowskii]QGU00926.1 1,4-alpha-glucan branching enzyme GlgB [Corynebacterium kalinowskii]